MSGQSAQRDASSFYFLTTIILLGIVCYDHNVFALVMDSAKYVFSMVLPNSVTSWAERVTTCVVENSL